MCHLGTEKHHMGKVIARHRGDLLFETKVGNHTLLVDVPAFAGGKERAPTATELLAASLASCVAAMVTVIAGRLGADTTDMSVAVGYEWARNPARLTDLQVEIHLPHVDEERRQAILKAARHCPVHETILALDSPDLIEMIVVD